MNDSDSHYVHGTEAWEQERLSKLNTLLNAASLEAMALSGGERVLDVGSGLGQFTRALARAAGPSGKVIGIERSNEQLAEANRQAKADREADLVEFRRGEVRALPLADDEWGTFDVVHTRFVLEHLTDPLAAVRTMVRAARPGGRIVLEDDDHEVLRMWPEAPGVLELWRAYYLTFERNGKDPYVGRRLVALLHEAGATPCGNRCLNFGSSAGSPRFAEMVANFAGVIRGAKSEILGFGLATEQAYDAALDALDAWADDPAAALWYSTCWAQGRRPPG